MHWIALAGALVISAMTLGATAKAEETGKDSAYAMAFFMNLVVVPVIWFVLGAQWPE